MLNIRENGVLKTEFLKFLICKNSIHTHGGNHRVKGNQPSLYSNRHTSMYSSEPCTKYHTCSVRTAMPILFNIKRNDPIHNNRNVKVASRIMVVTLGQPND